jgi:hypothetical protein
MAIARVQLGHTEALGTGTTIACTVNGIAANSLVVVNSTVEDLTTISSVQDDLLVSAAVATNTPVDWSDGSQRADQRYFENYGGGNRTFTTTFAASQPFRGINAIEYSGAATSSVYDKGSNQHDQASSSSISSGAVVPAQDGSLLVGYVIGSSATTFQAPFSNVLTDAVLIADTEDYIQAVAASIAATWTMSPAGIAGALVGVYKPAATQAPLQYNRTRPPLNQRVA